MLQLAIDDGPLRVLTEPDEILHASDVLVASSDQIVAHNTAFDGLVLETLLERDLAPEEWRDTRVIAAEHGFPGQVEDLALALGVAPEAAAGPGPGNPSAEP